MKKNTYNCSGARDLNGSSVAGVKRRESKENMPRLDRFRNRRSNGLSLKRKRK